MKKINQIYKSACLFGLLAVGLASCEDYLTLYPTDKVVEGNFWEDKTDLNGIRYGAYKQFAKTAEKMFLWGDLRSDSYTLNIETSSSQSSLDMYTNILDGMPDSTMGIYDWGEVYKTINLCNRVLKHGPEVLAKDKQFTTTEWIYMRAEMTALRALSYFYLIRAFKDVPYTTKLINSDKEVESFPLTNQLVVLDSIILDCESVAGQARNRFSKESETKGMITNAAIYAMLADMYLWRGSLHQGRNIQKDTVVVYKPEGNDSIAHEIEKDYRLAAEWAEKALDAHHNQVTEYISNLSFSSSTQKLLNYGFSNIDLIENYFDEAKEKDVSPILRAQNSIFNADNQGNGGSSIESIFEIQYSNSDGLKNEIINTLYGYRSGTHLMVAKDAMKEAQKGGTNDSKYLYDTRLWIGCQNYINENDPKQGFYCLKYQNPTVIFEGQENSKQLKYVTLGQTGNFNNWIIYRTTDVMLIKAEALACLNSPNRNDILKIVNAINRRSYCDYNTGKQADEVISDANESTIGNVKPADDKKDAEGSIKPPKIPGIVVTVMNQRQIELLGEGKRWFDLVRCAERYCENDKDPADERECPKGVKKGEPGYVGNGQSGMAALVYYFMKNSVQKKTGTLYTRFKNRWGLYCPIYYEEVKASNGKILQNPVWNKSRYEQ